MTTAAGDLYTFAAGSCDNWLAVYAHRYRRVQLRPPGRRRPVPAPARLAATYAPEPVTEPWWNANSCVPFLPTTWLRAEQPEEAR